MIRITQHLPTMKRISDSTIIVFWKHHFSQTKIVSYPPKAGLIEYWLEELLVAASKEGEEGGRRKVQQQQVKIVSLRSLSLMIWRYEIITDFFTFPLILETRRTWLSASFTCNRPLACLLWVFDMPDLGLKFFFVLWLHLLPACFYLRSVSLRRCSPWLWNVWSMLPRVNPSEQLLRQQFTIKQER